MKDCNTLRRESNETMPDRVSIDIEGLRPQLELIAVKEERKLAQLCRVLIKEGIERRTPLISDASEVIDFLRLLADGSRPSDFQIVELAHVSGISEEKLIELRDRLFPNGNGGGKKPNGNTV